MTTYIACDGSCIQQGTYRLGDDVDRPGAAAIVVKTEDGSMAVRSESFPDGTIGRMEVYGILMALQFVDDAIKSGMDGLFEIRCDSQYAVNGYNQWLEGWAKKGYHKKGGLANANLWRDIDALKAVVGNRVRIIWVKGHAGDHLNELADEAANSAARNQTSQNTLDTLLGRSANSEDFSAQNIDDSVDDTPCVDDFDTSAFEGFVDWLRDLEAGLPKEQSMALTSMLNGLKTQLEAAAGNPNNR